ncbi:MAG: PAS domain S-box protein, partial [Nitrospinae bacterium]|nr:PAS domain S-box protein [Nitrospinota bacterium]
AEDLGAGNFARRAEVETDDEVGELAKLFNSMAERLGSNFAKTESQNLELATNNVALEKTARERMALLEESESRFRHLSDATFEGIVIHHNGTITDCNETCLALTGYSRKELIGKNLLELLVAPESRNIVIEKIQTLTWT